MTLDLELSKLIYGLVEEYETEYSWKAHEDPMKNEYFGWTLVKTHDIGIDWDKEIPAPNFGEQRDGYNDEEDWLSMALWGCLGRYMNASTSEQGMSECGSYLRTLLK